MDNSAEDLINGSYEQPIKCARRTIPIDGDLKGYLSGRSTRTFQTPPSYGAEITHTVLKRYKGSV